MDMARPMIWLRCYLPNGERIWILGPYGELRPSTVHIANDWSMTAHLVLTHGVALQEGIAEVSEGAGLSQDEMDVLVFGSVENARAWESQWT